MVDVEVLATPIEGLQVVQRMVHHDERGSFERLFDRGWPAAAGGSGAVVQVNRSCTASEGTVRGLHFQYPPAAETRLVTCLSGAVFDVAVDLRHRSPTFLRWHGVELSAGSGTTFVVPQGFAHGFQTLTGDATLLYVHDGPYVPGEEGGIHPEEILVGVVWPLPVDGLSDRDAHHPPLDSEWEGLRL